MKKRNVGVLISMVMRWTEPKEQLYQNALNVSPSHLFVFIVTLLSRQLNPHNPI